MTKPVVEKEYLEKELRKILDEWDKKASDMLTVAKYLGNKELNTEKQLLLDKWKILDKCHQDLRMLINYYPDENEE